MDETRLELLEGGAVNFVAQGLEAGIVAVGTPFESVSVNSACPGEISAVIVAVAEPIKSLIVIVVTDGEQVTVWVGTPFELMKVRALSNLGVGPTVNVATGVS